MEVIPEIVANSLIVVRTTGTYAAVYNRGRIADKVILIGVLSFITTLRVAKVHIFIIIVWSSIFTTTVGWSEEVVHISGVVARTVRTFIVYVVLWIWTGIWAWSAVKDVIGRRDIACQRIELVVNWRLGSMNILKVEVLSKARIIFGQAIRVGRRVYRTVTVSRIWRRLVVINVGNVLFAVLIEA